MAHSSEDPPLEPLLIPRHVLNPMVEHCRNLAPLEACGLLTGVAMRASTHVPLRNAAASETYYEADSRDLIDAVVAMRGRGEQIVAIYHSHPRWPALPSRTDLAANHYGDVPRIIVSLMGPDPEVRAWRLEPESYSEVPWKVETPGVEDRAADE